MSTVLPPEEPIEDEPTFPCEVAESLSSSFEPEDAALETDTTASDVTELPTLFVVVTGRTVLPSVTEADSLVTRVLPASFVEVTGTATVVSDDPASDVAVVCGCSAVGLGESESESLPLVPVGADEPCVPDEGVSLVADDPSEVLPSWAAVSLVGESTAED